MTIHRRRNPKRSCIAVDTANWGYGPNEEIPCDRPAEFHTRFEGEPAYPWYMAGPWYMDREFNRRWAPKSPTRGRAELCTHHATQARKEYNEPVYRFRRVTSR